MSEDIIKDLSNINVSDDQWVYECAQRAIHEIKRRDDEIARLRVALERVARHDLQAIALDALAPGERIRAVDMKIVDEKPDLPRSISFHVGEH